ncbi:MAG: T9SS type A sorting domain-containing protein [Bacteroidota bacterium]
MTTNIWSNISHTGASCGCAPCVCAPCSIPSNSVVRISHIITLSCDMVIGSNSTIIIESGGALVVTGNGSVSGTGDFQVDAGGSVDISGNLNLSGSGDITINGDLSVGGNLTINGGATFCGSGTVSVSGSVSGSPDPCFTGTLPIELISFNAISNENKVEITWSTASELNNDYFTIERSHNGSSFEEIVRVDGAGTSTMQIDYFETDFSPLPGISYYRLKQTDYNGDYTYSQVVAVKREVHTGEFGLYPNPVNADEAFFTTFAGFGDEEVLVVLRDMSGKEYYSKVVVLTDNHQIVAFDPDQRIPAGTYLVIATSKDELYTQKLVVK